MITSKIYVHLIDGTDVWVPVDARNVGEDQYEILDGGQYADYDDPNYFFEFYPGDTVELGTRVFSNGKEGQVAKKLIKPGNWKDRKLNEFKFKATERQLVIDPYTANYYREEIEGIKQLHASGHVFYPAIMEIVEKLESISKNQAN